MVTDDLPTGTPRIQEVYEEIEDLANLMEYQREFLWHWPEAYDD